MTDQSGDGADRDAPCPDCGRGRVTVSDDLHATCDNCDAVVFRKEVGL